MSDHNPVLTEKKAPWFKIILNRPDDDNRITSASNDGITAALQEAEKDDEVKVVIITGNRHHFCTGGRHNPNATPEEKEYNIKSIQLLQKQFKECTKPLIAAIEGDCWAGGNDLLQNCDIAIARRGVTFCFPEIYHNAFPVMLVPALMEKIPAKKLFPAFITGEVLTAEEYETAGMLTKVVDDIDFWPTVYKYVEFLKARPAELIALGRKIFRTMQAMSFEDRIKYSPTALKEVWKVAGKYEF